MGQLLKLVLGWVLVLTWGTAGMAQTLTTLYNFEAAPGTQPQAGVVNGTDGNFYGTTVNGGTYGLGTVFKLTPTGEFTTLYAFSGGSEGANPHARLRQGADGNFYGTTDQGGEANLGTVFRITPTGSLTTLYRFTGPDGANPRAGLALDLDGTFLGTTFGGGASGLGTVFKITPAGSLTTLYSFGGLDGRSPYAALLRGTDGNFYGTTYQGGATNFGTAFRISPTGLLTTLHTFTGVGSEGRSPRSSLVVGIDGNFYGTTQAGGGTFGLGTVYRLTAQGTLTTIYSFVGAADGASPYGELLLATDGSFYGTAINGGTSGNGTVYQVTNTGTFTTLHLFTGTDGRNPYAGLVTSAEGTLYGTTFLGGAASQGTVYRLIPQGDLSTLTTLHTFPGGRSGTQPLGELLRTSDGTLYGTGSAGGARGLGTVFSFSNGTLVPLYGFSGPPDGATPQAGLTRAGDGNFYGTTVAGGANNRGAVFRLVPGGTVTTVASFTGGVNGTRPQAGLTVGPNGNLYGTTAGGGPAGLGTIFRVNLAGSITTLYSFASGGSAGATPRAGLTLGSDGNFYGTTADGGTNGSGTVFRITATGVLTSLYSFAGVDGDQPEAELTLDSDGNFYGTTAFGGTTNQGTVFQITPTGSLATLHSFTGSSGGATPFGRLVQGSDGNFYGTTTAGGATESGIVYQVSPTGVFSALYSFNGETDGALPLAGLVQDPAGPFYGVTSEGGANNTGTIYQLDPAPFLLSFTPVSGAPGTTVTLTGNFLNGTTQVTFNGTAASFTLNSSTEVTALVPLGASTGPLTLTTGNGTTTSPTAFTVLQLVVPLVTDFTPTSGTVGTSVVLTGLNFTGARAVQFNTTPAPGFIVNSDTQITVNVPAGATDGPIQVTSPDGIGTSLTNFAVLGPPVITAQPVSTVIEVGQTATLSVTASGGSLTYQWYQGPSGNTNRPISGATASSYTTLPLTTATNYWVRVRNSFGSADSTTTTVTVGSPPVITVQPASVTITSGQTATLSVTASGGSLTYQWYQGPSGNTNRPIAGATASSYTTLPLTTATNYWVRVINTGGTADSNTVTVLIGTIPTVTAIRPNPVRVGTTVTLSGTNLDAGIIEIRFNTALAPGFIVNSSTQITVQIPAGATTGPVLLTTATGTVNGGNLTVIPYAIKAVTWQMVGAADFNGDASPDIIWRNYTTGENEVWLMDGPIYLSTAPLPPVTDPTWQLVGATDFTQDGQPDLLWRNYQTGENAVWQMSGFAFVQAFFLDAVTDLTWQLVGTTDFTQDGQPDLLWRNYQTGVNAVWQLNGFTFVQALFIDAVSDPNWQLAGTGDLTGDGQPDLLWRNYQTGVNATWQLAGSAFVQAFFIDAVTDLNWQLVGAGDFTRDGQDDLLWRNVATGENAIWFMNSYFFNGAVLLPTRSAQ
ncbi:choice-of-anchor tandem repeat GloVer-containing protein [Candidatus Cyanaurora vandensis]|uniref:choice-of-anchor tandem repeat GloVer-containing protein n=1 Tax=Candidatus Cyanaurora vandensis TaxID=2714958 RepID=UPI002580F205|nr:choice-of-anchor tandem repeat GloVer-containing protein [Candidatus Cyanaurora vandensis]